MRVTIHPPALPARLLMPPIDILPPKRRQAPIIELQPIQWVDPEEILRLTRAEPSVTFDPGCVVQPGRRLAHEIVDVLDVRGSAASEVVVGEFLRSETV